MAFFRDLRNRGKRANPTGTGLAAMHVPVSAPLFAEYCELLANAGGADLVDSEMGPIGPGDALIVVDMQNDFVPIDAANPSGGALAVTEGGQIAPQIVRLMKHFSTAGATVVGTRDYHPAGHCSFSGSGGTFPAHCVQGSVGSHFYGPIGACVEELQQQGTYTTAFKGFHENVDSFGGLQYPDDDDMRARVCHNETSDFSKRLYGCSLAEWTGCYVLPCSNRKRDVNAPPDVLAAFSRQSLNEWLIEKGIKRVFACGLALDFCVTDTAVNAEKVGFEAFMILDAARAVHIPGHGKFGSGFVQDPADIIGKLRGASVRLVTTSAVCPSDVSTGSIAADSKQNKKISLNSIPRASWQAAKHKLSNVVCCALRPNVELPEVMTQVYSI